MTIHVTPIPSTIELTTPAFELGVTNTAGASVSAVAADSTLLAFDETLPDAITYGQSGVVGVATVASRRDHAHAMAAESPLAASVAEMEAASSNTVYATPGRTQNHPGVAKVWNYWEQSGAHGIKLSYNMTSITDGGGAGDTDHTFGTDFSTANFSMVAMGNYQRFLYNNAVGAATATTITMSYSGTAEDSGENFIAVFGDQ